MSRPAALLRNAARQARIAPSPGGLQTPLPRAGSSMTKRPLSILRSASTPTRLTSPTAISSRSFTSSSVQRHGEVTRPAPGTGIKVTYRDSKGNDIKTVEGNEGDDLLILAHEYDIDLEGACDRSVACSTCHVIIDPKHYDMLPEPDDEENDMLDLAFGLEDTSRLGCQVKLTKELDGMVATLPAATRNMYVDGAKARTH
ncbi:hypothetical protein EHS25_003866 [Saitozyma podzolica]|uniref:2Fe-2S ferredoxin-type domain-containing protein n=1 Tax=Saitozyma podzolica TaxID=1890683 RepID=A0A427Y3R8_9TREE|nr:hypothetical protein EHS25_003866 [Saitozyma podzolica]